MSEIVSVIIAIALAVLCVALIVYLVMLLKKLPNDKAPNQGDAADFFARIAAKYNSYVERENMKAVAQRKEQDAQSLVLVYPDYAEVVKQSINNCATVLDLAAVSDISQVVTNTPVKRTKQGLMVMLYRAYRSGACSASAEQVKRMLQTEADTLCDMYGLPLVKVHVGFGADNRVNIGYIPMWSIRSTVTI